MKDLDDLVLAFEKETTASGQRSILAKIQVGLIAAQDIGDDKLVTVQAMSDLIENKSRQLEHDSKILDFGKDDEEEPVNTSSSKPLTSTAPQTSTISTAKSGQNTISKSTKEKEKDGKKPFKRRKQHTETKSRAVADDRDDDEVSNISNRSGGSRSRQSTGTGSGGTGTGNKRQAVKRKAQGKRYADKDDSDREIDLNLEIDPDEPTYCLCDQVSFEFI